MRGVWASLSSTNYRDAVHHFAPRSVFMSVGVLDKPQLIWNRSVVRTPRRPVSNFAHWIRTINLYPRLNLRSTTS